MFSMTLLSGYTEDTVNGTGYVDDLNNYNVAGLKLYTPVVGTDGQCSPNHTRSFNSTNNSSKCVS
jgi:hypothetical protein